MDRCGNQGDIVIVYIYLVPLRHRACVVNILQRIAVDKCAAANICNAFRYRNALQVRTAIEHRVSDACYTFVYHDLLY